jgi:segregation and condensation protein A
MPDYLEGITLRGLSVICADIDSRRETFLLEAEHIAPKRLPVALTVASVDRVTRAHPLVTFSKLLDGQTSPEQVVVTFLAVLELYKAGSIRMSQDENFGEIDIERVEGAPAFEADELELSSTMEG